MATNPCVGQVVSTDCVWIADFRVWDHERSLEEINALYRMSLDGTEEGLRLHYDFSNSNNPGQDRSGSNHHGLLKGDAKIVSVENWPPPEDELPAYVTGAAIDGFSQIP